MRAVRAVIRNPIVAPSTAPRFDRFLTEEQYGWRVATYSPNAIRILDTEDLHFLRKARQTAVKEQREFLHQDLFSEIGKKIGVLK